MIAFKVYGPFKIPFDGNVQKKVKDSELNKFWQQGDLKKIQKKQGLYIFALQAGKGYTPWYVGKTAKQDFVKECFTTDKLNKYNKTLFKGLKGTPVMFFIARPGNKKKAPNAIVDNMETFFIQEAKYKNSGLLNTQKAKLPEWGIDGVIRSGKGTSSKQSRGFKKLMGL